jgi:lipopolysaccharide/colanic/teichoic acid biosynthesis glycosyltransferase
MVASVPRVIHVALAMAALLVLSPVFLVVSLAAHLFLGRPVIFRQVRAGISGRPFVLLKFRTMHEIKDGQPADDASRLTRFGRFLRSTSLDELPGLINVVRGEMNLVGPRPLLPEYLSLYTVRQARRHEVRPGITGWAQINGRNSLTWEQRLEFDVWYVENRSWWLDLRILLRTVAGVLTRQGISQPGHPTMERFDARSR